MKHNKTTLQRSLSPMHVWALAFGCIIGWGSFINPGKKFLPNSGVEGTAIAMLLGAAVMLVIAFTYAYMVPRYPKAGGGFTFAKNCLGKYPAFLCGWFLVATYLSNVPMNSTAIGLIVDSLDGPLDLLKWGFHYSIAGFDVWLGEIVLASFVLILFGILNILGVKKAGFLQTVLSSMLVISIVVLSIAALASDKTNISNMHPMWGFDRKAALATGVSPQALANVGTKGIITAILATFAITPWAYVGFDTIPQAAEEFKFSNKKVMLIMTVAILFGAFVYIANNTVAAAAVRDWPQRVMAGEWVLLIAAEEMLGIFGKVLVGVAVSCAVLSGIMGFYLASSRIMYSMSRDGFLPSTFGKIDPRFGTPRNAILFCIIISLSGPVLGREALCWFVDMSAIGASIGFLFTALSTIVTLKRNNDDTRGRMTAAIIAAAFSSVFIIIQVIPIPGLSGVHFVRESYIMLVVWIVMGIAFAARQRKHFATENK